MESVLQVNERRYDRITWIMGATYINMYVMRSLNGLANLLIHRNCKWLLVTSDLDHCHLFTERAWIYRISNDLLKMKLGHQKFAWPRMALCFLLLVIGKIIINISFHPIFPRLWLKSD